MGGFIAHDEDLSHAPTSYFLGIFLFPVSLSDFCVLVLSAVVDFVQQDVEAQLVPRGQAGGFRIPLCQAGAHQGLPQGWTGGLGEKAH